MTQIQPGFDELLRDGGAALRGGQRERARSLLAQAVRLNPRSEQAWLLLAGAVSDAEQRRTCLERVLRLNPDHAIARKAMASLGGSGDRRPTTGDQPRPSAATDDRRPTTGNRPLSSAAQVPPGGSLLERLQQAEQPARELPSFEQLLAGPAPASPQPTPASPPPMPASEPPAPPSVEPHTAAPPPATATPPAAGQQARGFLSFEALVATPTPASPSPAGPQPPALGELAATPPAVPPQPAPASPQPPVSALPPLPAGQPAGGLIELSAAGLRRKKRERQLWMAVLAVGVLMMLAGLVLALIVLLTG